ncbi:MAG: DUF2339 domain-containing protein [Steroidobacteraceae bacterium]
MHPILRVVLVIVGAVVGANLGTEGVQFLAALVGALAGLAISEVVYIRGAFATLRTEFRELRDLIERRATRTDAPAAAPKAEPTPRSAPPRSEPAPYYERAPSQPAAPPAAPATTAPIPREQPSVSREDWGERYIPRPIEPAGDNPLVALLRDYFTGGNALVRAGIVVLLFGVGFLLRYLAEHSHIPIEFRLCGVAAGALMLLALGWRLRTKRLGYALALQGGAVGILYLTVFAALHLYSILSPTAAFALLAAISALSATLAVLQNSLAVALLSVSGGFLAPFLASTGHGDHVVLFSYFAVLNGVILGIAWFRSWRLLNVAGFVFTFVLSTVWGVLQYRPQDFASSEPFLIGFFLLYVAIAVLYSTRQAPVLHGYLDGTIIFGTPIAAFGLQAAMLHDQRLALAYSALGVSALYTLLAWSLHRRKGDYQRLLVEAFMALGVAFLTLAVPLALNGRWSAASWALEGTALVWVGCRQDRRLPRAFGALLQLAAGCALVMTIRSSVEVPSGTYVAALMVGVASTYAARILHANRERLSDYELPLSALLFLWGLLWWCAGGISELRQQFAEQYQLPSSLVFATFTALVAGIMASRARMRIALLPAFGLLPVMALFALWAGSTVHHPLAQGGWVAWPLAFLGLYFILRQHDQALDAPLTNASHAVTLWLLSALVSWEVAWGIGQTAGTGGAWSIVAWGIVPAAMLALLAPAVAVMRWPFKAHRTAYAVVAAAGFSVYLALWSLYTDASVSSPSAPLPYLPVLNPLDLTQALVLVVLIRAWQRLRTEEERSALSALDPRVVVVGIIVVGFAWLNAVLLRTLHLWVGIPYELEAMMQSTLAQSALSLLWASTALPTMLVATRIRARLLWLTGAGLLVVVVIKLFLVDLSSIGTVERIVSFIGVGLLMLVIGYFSPLPPAAEEAR